MLSQVSPNPKVGYFLLSQVGPNPKVGYFLLSQVGPNHMGLEKNNLSLIFYGIQHTDLTSTIKITSILI